MRFFQTSFFRQIHKHCISINTDRCLLQLSSRMLRIHANISNAPRTKLPNQYSPLDYQPCINNGKTHNHLCIKHIFTGTQVFSSRMSVSVFTCRPTSSYWVFLCFFLFFTKTVYIHESILVCMVRSSLTDNFQRLTLPIFPCGLSWWSVLVAKSSGTRG